MLIGPMISLATTGVLYSAFFRLYPRSTLAEMSDRNFVSFIVFGFLVHSYLNSGYYFFCSKIGMERAERTLSLLWLSRCHPTLLLLGLSSMEVVRCLFISFLGILVLGAPRHSLIFALTQEFLCFSLLFSLGLLLGLMRAGLGILHEGKAEFADNAYLIFVFTACLYIPKSLLPGFLHPLCEVNPVYHGANAMRIIWEGGSPIPHLAILLLLIGLTAGICLFLWKRFQPLVMERAVA